MADVEKFDEVGVVYTSPDGNQTYENLGVIGDSFFSFARFKCKACPNWHQKLYRWRGARFSLYRLDDDWSREEILDFIHNIEQHHNWSAWEYLENFLDRMNKLNSAENGIRADNSNEFLELEYGRQRALTLNELGYLNALSNDPPENDVHTAIKAAYELGVANAEYMFYSIHEESIYEAWRMKRYRNEGRPAAVAARQKIGKRSLGAIKRAALKLLQEDFSLFSNRSKIARLIEEQKLPELRKSDGTFLGFDAIYKHLSTLFKDPNFQKDL